MVIFNVKLTKTDLISTQTDLFIQLNRIEETIVRKYQQTFVCCVDYKHYTNTNNPNEFVYRVVPIF